MTLSANATATPPATPAPPQSDFAQTQALIQSIASEARAAGKTLVFDPDAPADDEGSEGAGEDGGEQGEAATADGEASEGESGEEGESPTEEEAATPPGQLDAKAIRAAIGKDGTVNLEKLAEALGIKPEALALTPGQFKANRIERRKAQQTLERAHELTKTLEQRYGDQVKARKAAADGDLQPAIEFIENTFGMGWNDLNKMIVDLLQGKPIADLDQKRELRTLKKREEERAAEAKKAEQANKRVAQVKEAKDWIRASIKGDKLADAALSEQLRAAGMPSIVDMVFEELQQTYSKGQTDPRKALETVKAKLAKHAKALQGAGVIPKSKPAAARPLSASPSRAEAQAGSAGNGRPMTDAELRVAVLKEAGLYRK